jgi:hypothetical protein
MKFQLISITRLFVILMLSLTSTAAYSKVAGESTTSSSGKQGSRDPWTDQPDAEQKEQPGTSSQPGIMSNGDTVQNKNQDSTERRDAGGSTEAQEKGKSKNKKYSKNKASSDLNRTLRFSSQ